MEPFIYSQKRLLQGLNPYYNGRYSWREAAFMAKSLETSLNPYYNGRYSWRYQIF